MRVTVRTRSRVAGSRVAGSRVAGSRVDVDVDVDAVEGTSLAEMMASLGLPRGRLWIEGKLCDPEGPLPYEGAIVCTSAPPRPGAGALELRTVGGLDAGRRWAIGPGEHLIGRSADCDIVLLSPTVSGHHAKLHVSGDSGAAEIVDLASLNGTLEHDGVWRLGAVEVSVTPRGVRRSVTVGPLHRPPCVALPEHRIAIEEPVPPQPPRPGMRLGIAPIIAPMLAGLLMAILFNPALALLSFLSPVLFVGNWLEDRRRIGRTKAENVRATREAMVRFVGELEAAAGRQRAHLRLRHPDAAELAVRAISSDPRRWERRAAHRDFLRLRVGTGDVGWTPHVVQAPGPRLDEARAALEAASVIRSAPVAVDLRAGCVVGIAGSRNGPGADLARSLVLQAAVLHGPADVRIAVRCAPDRERAWEWTRWLPHTRHPVGNAWLLQGDVPPGALLVVDGVAIPRSLEGPAIVLADSVDALPSCCTTIIAMDRPDAAHGLAVLTDVGTGTSTEVLVMGVTPRTAGEVAHALAPLTDPEAVAGAVSIQERGTLLDLIGAGPDLVSAIGAGWMNSSAARATRLPVAIGWKEDGPFTVDLVTDGPHVLLAGTTGSGKSELLRTFVAALAAGHDPDHVNFLLIDYKGGSAFDVCARLPHTVGMVTDLDEQLAARALTCLEAELRHRERVLRGAGAMDLIAYHAADGLPPLPRLVVVVDEFAALAAELPGFLRSLVDVAQRGRSLGVHLVLATQRPSGSVSDQIRANTNLRICLRVQDSADSSDVIATPVAASISRHQPGSGYARLGPSEVVAFRAAEATATSSGTATSAVNAGNAGNGVTAGTGVTGVTGSKVVRLGFGPQAAGGLRTTATTRAYPSTGTAAASRPTDLSVVADAVAENFALRAFAPPRRPWPEPLPTMITVGNLAQHECGSGASGWTGGAGAGVCAMSGAFALVDEPELQRQRPLAWTPSLGNLAIFGVAGSGTTTALRALILSVARQYEPHEAHFQILDFGNGDLAAAGSLPHVGSVVGPLERERQTRLLRWLRDELDRRKGLPPEPLLVLALDGYGAFGSALDDALSTTWRDIVARLVGEGPGVRMYTWVTADRVGALPSSLAAVIANKIVLPLADPLDYAQLGIERSKVPAAIAGRAFLAASKSEAQIGFVSDDDFAATAAISAISAISVEASSTPMAAITAGRCSAPAHQVRPVSIGTLPTRVATEALLGQTHATPEGALDLAVGIGDRALMPVGWQLREGEHALITGPGRAGKSTALLSIAMCVLTDIPGLTVTVMAPRRASPLMELARSGRVALATAAADLDILLHCGGPQLLLIDDADELDGSGDIEADLARLLAARRADLHVVGAARPDRLRARYGDWTAELRRARHGLALRPIPEHDGDLWHTRLPQRGPSQWGDGRGYLIAGGTIEIVQCGSPL